jgi:hypothetical protein
MIIQKTPTATRRQHVSSFAKYAVYTFLAAILLLGITCLAASLVPYASIYQMLLRQYGRVLLERRLTQQFYEQKQMLVRLVGCAALVLTGVVYWLRFALAEFLTTTLFYLHRGWQRSLVRARYAIRRADPSEIFDLLAVTVVALIDRLFFLSQPVRFDEAVSYMDYASKPLYLLLSVYTEPENHVLNSVLVHFSTVIFGNHLWSLRLPALCAGTLLVPVAYLACRQLFGRLPAIVAASLVATSSLLILYSTNGRGYTIVGCSFMLLILCGALVLRKSDQVLFLVLAIATAIGFYAIPIMLFPAAAVLLWLALCVWRRPSLYVRSFWRMSAEAVAFAGLLTILLYLPVFIVSGVKAVVANPYVTKLHFTAFLTKNATYFGDTWHLWNQDLPAWGALLVLAGFTLSLALPFRQLSPNRRFVAAICLACLLTLAIFRFAPFPRVWQFLLPVYFFSAAKGWVCLSQRINRGWAGWQTVWRIVAFAILVSLSFHNVSRRNQLDSEETETGACRNAEQVADFLIQNHIPIEQLIRPAVCNMTLLYYYLPKSGRQLQEVRFLPALQPKPNPNAPPAPAAPQGKAYWVFVNSSQGNTLGKVLERDNLDGIKVLSKVEFDSGYLSQIEVEE